MAGSGKNRILKPDRKENAKMKVIRLVAAAGLALAVFGSEMRGQETAARKQILSDTTMWRHYFTFMPPVMHTETGIEKVSLTMPKAYYGINSPIQSNSKNKKNSVRRVIRIAMSTLVPR